MNNFLERSKILQENSSQLDQSVKEISKVVSQNANVSKKEIYSYCLKLKNEI